MTRLLRFESRVSMRVVAGASSVVLHLGLLFLIIFSGGRHDGIHEGDTPITRLVLIEDRQADRREGIEAPPREPVVPKVIPPQELAVESNPPPRLPSSEAPPKTVEPEVAIVAQSAPITATMDTPPLIDSPNSIDVTATVVLPQAVNSALVKRLAHLAEELAKAPRTQVTWEEEGIHYQAALVLERAKNGADFDRVVAEVSAEELGRQLTTHIRLKRLAFSHYTQMIDRWDPMVQLHDDEIVGRFHVNSQFNLFYDGRKTPKFLGKVTTAAGSFNTLAAGRRRESEIFRGGIETHAGLIVLPEQLQPFEWAPRDEKARIHEFGNDTRIRFFADGSYAWRDRNTDAAEYRNEPTQQPVYFIASRAATLYVQGVVCGRMLVYSPQKIVVEGNLTYAHNPREVPDSSDYLGLVSDRYVEVAPVYVTGPGDVDIHAAIFAGRRFVVRDIDYGRPATLRIYGSLAAGTVSATEPRYATKIEYDSRFERQRPPGFPSTSRFAAEEWDGKWTDVTERSASERF